MTSGSAAAGLLVLALLLLPNTPLHRLIAVGLIAARPRPALRSRWRHWPLVGLAVVASAALPLAPLVAVGVVAATTILRRRQGILRRRAEQESRELGAALGVLVRELRIGVHPVDAFRSAASDGDGTVGVSFREVAARAVLGADVAAGLSAVAASSALPTHWRRLAVCWELAQLHGLTMASLMQAAGRDIAERDRFHAGVHAAMAGPRATAAVLAGLPLVGIALGQLLGADPARFLLSSGIGGWFLVSGVTLVCGGLLWSDRITQRALR